jgi:hypothetical protein
MGGWHEKHIHVRKPIERIALKSMKMDSCLNAKGASFVLEAILQMAGSDDVQMDLQWNGWLCERPEGDRNVLHFRQPPNGADVEGIRQKCGRPATAGTFQGRDTIGDDTCRQIAMDPGMTTHQVCGDVADLRTQAASRPSVQ